MLKSISAMLEGFSDRAKHIAMFAPILRVEQPAKFTQLPVPSIALYVLLYMLENKISFNKNTTKNELQQEIWTLARQYFLPEFSLDDASELEDWLVSKHLRNRGNAHVFSYYDFETGEEKSYSFHLIEYGESTNVFSDRKNGGEDDFVLTDVGKELLFTTKEIYGELRITINQLFFKRQFEKGLFTDALRQIQEMHVFIDEEKRQMRKLQGRIIRDALGVSQRNELEESLKRIHDTLQTEKEQFRELKDLVEEKIDEYYEGSLTEKEQEGIHIIQEIDRKLDEAIYLHESLFSEKQKTQNLMSGSLESSIVHAFSVFFDFDQELLQPIMEHPPSLENLNQISKPLLPLHHQKIFNPLLVFANQNRLKRKESKEEILIQMNEEAKRMQEEKEEREKVKREKEDFEYLSALMLKLADTDSFYLSDAVKEIQTHHIPLYEKILYQPDSFLGFITELHQSDYNRFELVKREVSENLPDDKKINRLLIRLTQAHPELEKVSRFSMLETDFYHFLGSLRYRDILFVRGDYYGMGSRND